MTEENDNFLIFFLFSFFAGPPDKLAEALIFILNFYEVTEAKKSILRIGKMFGIQFILVTYSGNSMNSAATFCVVEETDATLQRVESKKRFQVRIQNNINRVIQKHQIFRINLLANEHEIRL